MLQNRVVRFSGVQLRNWSCTFFILRGGECMNFGLFCIMYATSFIVCFCFISIIWRVNFSGFNGRFTLLALRNYNTLSRIWPDDSGFWSLKFSALRHTLIPLVFSALIYFLNISWLNTALITLSLLYVYLKCVFHNTRRKEFKTAKSEAHSFLKPVKTASFSVVALSVINHIILMFSYAYNA